MSVVAVKHPAWRLDDLAVPRPPKLPWRAATFRMIGELLDVIDDALDERGCSGGILERDVVRDGIQIAQRRL